MGRTLLEKLKESVLSVLPVSALIIILSLTIADISSGIIVLFSVSALFLIIGMALFTLGSDVAMMPIGSSIGSFLSKTRKNKFFIVALVVLIIGFVITIAEPDLQVLSVQLDSKMIVYTVAAGVGIFLVVSVAKTFFNIKLKYLLLGFYLLVFILGIALQFVNPHYLAAAFDSGGVTTGPVTVPFLMAFGLGIASVRGSKGNQEDSFGMVALCSIGPVLAVMLMGLTSAGSIPEVKNPADSRVVVSGASDIFSLLGEGLVHSLSEVALALVPIVGVFILFQIFVLKLNKRQVIRIVSGLVYTYVGLTVFLTGVNVGFLPMGQMLGSEIASKSYNEVLIPIGMLMGALIVLAEPAIHVLTKQVEEVTGGSISKKVMLISLSIGVAVAIGLSMLRVVFGISIWWFLVPVYAISLLLMFFVPNIFTGIAFDSGGVASGPMTATFMLPLAVGACFEIWGTKEAALSLAFGLVAFVAMTPLITIQLVGLVFKLKTRRLTKKQLSLAIKGAIDSDEGVIEFEEAAYDDSDVPEISADSPDTDDSVEFDADSEYDDVEPPGDFSEEALSESVNKKLDNGE